MTNPPSSILVTVTSPGDSRPAVNVAASLAERLGAELVVAGIVPVALPILSVDVPNEPAPLYSQPDQQRLLERLVRERLDEIAGELPPEVRARTRMSWGPVGPGIVALAEEEGADLVVVAMRRGSELHHILHDHADRHVLHHCPVPVVVVPTGAVDGD